MKFAIITDIHYGADNLHIIGSKAPETLPAILDKIKTFNPKFMVNLGDYTQSGDTSVFLDVVGLFKNRFKKNYFVLGNHDVYEFSKEELKEMLGIERTYYSADYEDYKLIFLDCQKKIEETDYLKERENHNNYLHSGYIDAEQLKWLESELDTRKRVIVFTHQPLIKVNLEGNMWFENKPYDAFVENRAEVIKILEKKRNVSAVFSGHLHSNYFKVHNNIPYFIIQSYSQSKDWKTNGNPCKDYALVEIDSKRINVEVLGDDKANFHYQF